MKEENEGDKTHIGLIAQEVQPEVVHECFEDDNTFCQKGTIAISIQYNI